MYNLVMAGAYDETIGAVKEKLDNKPVKPIKKTKGLTLKQKKFVNEYIKSGGDGGVAVLKAGYNAKDLQNARVIASKNLQKPHVSQAIEVILVKQGLSQPDVVKLLDKAIQKGLKGKATTSDALRGIDMALKLHQAYPTPKLEIDKREVKLTIEGKGVSELGDKLDALLEDSQAMRKAIVSPDDV